MSGNRFLLDTNILIYLSKGELILTDFAASNDYLYISVITLMEVKGFTFKSLKEERIVNSLCSMITHVYINEAIVEEVINRRLYKRMQCMFKSISAWQQNKCNQLIIKFIHKYSSMNGCLIRKT